MRASRFLLATLRETPSDAVVISHQLLAARGQIAVVAKRTGSGGVAKVLSLSSGEL